MNDVSPPADGDPLETREWLDAHLEDLDPWVLQMAIEHRHMHAETFAYLLHGLPYGEKKQADAGSIAQIAHTAAPPNDQRCRLPERLPTREP